MAPSKEPPSNGYHYDDEEENGGWTPIANDPNLLSNWLNGKTRDETLKNWLESKYPQGISDSVLDDIVEHVLETDQPVEPVNHLGIEKSELLETKEEEQIKNEEGRVKKKTNEIEFMNWNRAKKRIR